MPAYKDNKTGKWFCKFYYTDWQGNNKQKWKRGFATKKEALAYERDFLEKQSANPDMTFQNLYELYMEDMIPRLKQSTIMTKKHICETHILPFFGNKPVNEIKASDVRRWQNKLMNSPKRYSKTYLKTINNQLTCIINYAKRFYDLNTNPCGQAGSIGQSKAEEMDYWTYDEYISFREGIKDKPLSYICFQVLYWTGMREGELLALTAADIDFVAKQIDINKTYQRLHGEDVFTTPKTRKSKRKVPIPDFLCRELQEYMDSKYMLDPGERLFPVTKSYLSHEMDRGCKNTGVKRIRIHDIRHSHASMLINMGVELLEISRRLGHESVKTTSDTYGHLYKEKDANIASKLNDLKNQGDEVDMPKENFLATIQLMGGKLLDDFMEGSDGDISKAYDMKDNEEIKKLEPVMKSYFVFSGLGDNPLSLNLAVDKMIENISHPNITD